MHWGLRTADSGLWTADFGLWTAECGVRTGYKTGTKNYGLDIKRGLGYKIWTAD